VAVLLDCVGQAAYDGPVKDEANRYVTYLQASDFLVFEDGLKQEVTFVGRTQQPQYLLACWLLAGPERLRLVLSTATAAHPGQHPERRRL
jgi:hypothetical protein